MNGKSRRGKEEDTYPNALLTLGVKYRVILIPEKKIIIREIAKILKKKNERKFLPLTNNLLEIRLDAPSIIETRR